MIAIVICYRLNFTRLNIVEQGFFGSSFDIIINILNIKYLKKNNVDVKVNKKDKIQFNSTKGGKTYENRYNSFSGRYKKRKDKR